LSALEIKNYEYVKEYVKKVIPSFLGKMLEKYFREQIALSGEYSYVGSYWDRKSENEIDIIAMNEIKKKALIAEVKLNKEKININLLKKKAEKLLDNLKGYEIEYRTFCLNDVLIP
jgi:DNA topoisomerase IA